MHHLLERLRRAEYTGPNRCWPCTIANAGLLAILVGALAIARRRLAAALVAVAGAAAIALRGYVVPYTPQFAPYLTAHLPFDRPETADAGSLAEAGRTGSDTHEDHAPTGEGILAALLEAGVVVPEGEELFLDPEFRDDWHREMRALRDQEFDELARIADRVTEPAIRTRVYRGWGSPHLVLEGPNGGLVTLGRAVAVAELAAARALERRVDDRAIRRTAGRPLRSLLEACPRCDGPLEITASSCCGEVTPLGSTPDEKLYCPNCNVRLFTFD
jgi:hypothetical protein